MAKMLGQRNEIQAQRPDGFAGKERIMIKKFQRYHNEDTSYKTKKQARKNAIEALKACEGFMLFTVQKNGQELVYKGNAFIDKDYAQGMPAFINQVMDQRKDQFKG